MEAQPGETVPTDQIDLTAYYHLETSAGEWLWVINRLIRDHADKASPDDAMLGHGEGVTTFLLKKTRFTAAILAKALGVSPEAIEKAPKIVLKSLDTPEKFPAPTVDYVGVA